LKSYYEILELKNYASNADIKKAFKRLALLYHPDKNPDNKIAEELFKEINEAYQILSNELTKSRYDQLLALGYHHSQLKNGFFNKEQDKSNIEEEERFAAKQAAWREHLRRKTEKTPYDVSNVQGVFFAVLFIAYCFAFTNTMIDSFSRMQYLWAVKAVENKQYKKALEHLEVSMAADHRFTKSYALAAKIEVEQFKHYATAIPILTHAIHYMPILHTEYYYQRGVAFCHLGETRAAKADFNVMLRYYPDSLALKKEIANHYYYTLQNDGLSEAMFVEIIKKDAKNETLAINLGDISLRKKNYQVAINYYEMAIKNGNKSAETYSKQGMCYLDLQNIPKACETWQKAKQINPKIKNDILELFCVQ
jgi:curved DNA-binding protein CbpA